MNPTTGPTVTVTFKLSDLKAFLRDADKHGMPDLETAEGTDTVLVQLGEAIRVGNTGGSWSDWAETLT